MSHQQRHRSRGTFSAVLAVAISVAVATSACSGGREAIPDRLDDSTFWTLVNELSEEGGYFHSDNFVSNELGFQHVLTELAGLAGSGVYMGVGPDQNFTYVVNLRPSIAFIVDIRRQNMLQHLMYKALIEMSSDRAEFLARLFARPVIEKPSSDVSADSLFTWLSSLPRDTVIYREQMTQMVVYLREKGIRLTQNDLNSMAFVYGAFVSAGPALTYSSNTARSFGTRGMPSYRTIMTATDQDGVNQGYLGSEQNFLALKDMQERNLIVPVVGDFAGPKAIRAVGNWARRMNATVNTFYVSNVEQYLFQQAEAWSSFYANVSELPLHRQARFIRSVSGRNFRRQHPLARSASRTSPVHELLDQFRSGRLQSYADIVEISR